MATEKLEIYLDKANLNLMRFGVVFDTIFKLIADHSRSVTYENIPSRHEWKLRAENKLFVFLNIFSFIFSVWFVATFSS